MLQHSMSWGPQISTKKKNKLIIFLMLPTVDNNDQECQHPINFLTFGMFAQNVNLNKYYLWFYFVGYFSLAIRYKTHRVNYSLVLEIGACYFYH